MILEHQCLFDPTKFIGITPDILKNNTDMNIIDELLQNNVLFGTWRSFCTRIAGIKEDYTTIDLSIVSHRIINLNWDGNYIYGDVEILETECGKIIEKYIDRLKFIPRLIHVKEHYLLITFDVSII